MPSNQRYLELKKKDLCTQCLYPGACSKIGKHAEGKCWDVFTCKHPSHNSSLVKKHILVCHEHREEDANKSLLEEYKAKKIVRNSNNDLPEFAKSIKLSFHVNGHHSNPVEDIDTASNVVTNSGIYMMQQIQVDGNILSLFFDSGCGDVVSKYDAVTKLGANARKVKDGPIPLSDVGGINV